MDHFNRSVLGVRIQLHSVLLMERVKASSPRAKHITENIFKARRCGTSQRGRKATARSTPHTFPTKRSSVCVQNRASSG